MNSTSVHTGLCVLMPGAASDVGRLYTKYMLVSFGSRKVLWPVGSPKTID